MIVLIPQIFATYLPAALGPLPTLLFGVGAVLLARNPDGIITMNGRQLAALGRRLTGGGKQARESRAQAGQLASKATPELEDVQ
jgi:branched-chain amino acid transport system permease protein